MGTSNFGVSELRCAAATSTPMPNFIKKTARQYGKMYTSRSFHNLYATVPTWLVKDMKALLSPFIKLLCNKSLAVGCFPSDFKRAVVRPLLRRADWTPAR